MLTEATLDAQQTQAWDHFRTLYRGPSRVRLTLKSVLSNLALLKCLHATCQICLSFLFFLKKFNFSRGVKSTWKPYLSRSTDTLQWKLIHYNLQVTNSKTTWVKVLEDLILTVLKYFTYTKYRLKDALVKETSRSKTVTLWRSWGKQA